MRENSKARRVTLQSKGQASLVDLGVHSRVAAAQGRLLRPAAHEHAHQILLVRRASAGGSSAAGVARLEFEAGPPSRLCYVYTMAERVCSDSPEFRPLPAMTT